MKRTTTATGLLTLLAMFVLGAFSAGSASAVSQFLWTGPLPGLVLILNDNKQVFQTEPGGLIVECEHFGAHGIASNGVAMTAKEITITGLYTKCKAAGTGATVTPVQFLIFASGLVSVVGAPIVITSPTGGCSVKINNGGANENLEALRYLVDPSNAAALLVHAEVVGIHSTGSGGICGTAGVEKTNGSYKGLFLAFLDGGSIRWDP
jgi:hypothetical protein